MIRSCEYSASNCNRGSNLPAAQRVQSIAGMHLARNKADPEFKRRGALGGPALVAFTSEQAHYSYQKVVALTGLGTNNLISVPCDDSGAMSTEGVTSPSLTRAFSPQLHHTVGSQRAQPHACYVIMVQKWV